MQKYVPEKDIGNQEPPYRWLMGYTGCSGKLDYYWSFGKWSAIGVNVHPHSVDHFEDLLQRYVGEVAVDFLSIIHPLQCIHGYNNNNIGEKKTIFMSNMLTNYILIHLQ